MSKTDWAVLGLNALTLLAAVVGLMANQTDPMGYGLVLAFVATTSTPTNCSTSTHALRRSSAATRGRSSIVVRGPASDGGEAEHVRAGQPLSNSQ